MSHNEDNDDNLTKFDFLLELRMEPVLEIQGCHFFSLRSFWDIEKKITRTRKYCCSSWPYSLYSNCWASFSVRPKKKKKGDFFRLPVVRQMLLEGDKITSATSTAAAGEKRGKVKLWKMKESKNAGISLWFRGGCRITGGEGDELSPRGLF